MHTHIQLIVFPVWAYMVLLYIYLLPVYQLCTKSGAKRPGCNQGHCAKFESLRSIERRPHELLRRIMTNGWERARTASWVAGHVWRRSNFPVRGQRLSLLKLLRSTWGMFNSNAVGQKDMLCFHSQSHCLWTKSCTAFGIDVEYPMDRMVFYSYPRLRWSCPSTHCVSSTPFNRWT